MSPETESLYAQLRRLVLQDPSKAARVFLNALQGNDPQLDSLLVRLSSPGEGRLRQLVANALRNHHDKERIASYLHSWRATEADEFTRRALNAALSDLDSEASQFGASRERPAAPDFLDTYQYVSGRLKHKILNPVLGAQGDLLELRRRIDTIPAAAADQDLQHRINRLTTAISKIGRAIGAVDVEPTHFASRKIDLRSWLGQMNARYSTQYSAVALKIDCPAGAHPIVEASDYLLETIFWNLWTNAQQAVVSGCEITIQVHQQTDSIEVLLIDNGPGLPAESIGVAFAQQFSKKSPHRGRGLLEVADAVKQLHGSADLVEYARGELRVRLILPLSTR
jgi:signal transduction histidine kinase